MKRSSSEGLGKAAERVISPAGADITLSLPPLDEQMNRRVPPPAQFLNRELGFLAFNRRVLAQAADEAVPLLERLRFLTIVSSNLDEFFEIRVAGLKEQIKLGLPEPGPDGAAPGDVFQAVSRETQLDDTPDAATPPASGVEKTSYARRTWLLWLGLLGGLYVWTVAWYGESFASMATIWWLSETFAHGLIVYPMCAWLVWRERGRLAELQPQPSALAIVSLIGAGAAWLVASAGGVQATISQRWPISCADSSVAGSRSGCNSRISRWTAGAVSWCWSRRLRSCAGVRWNCPHHSISVKPISAMRASVRSGSARISLRSV